MSACVICEKRVAGLDFCQKHYAEYKDFKDEPWMKVLHNSAQKARRDMNREWDSLVSLDHLEESIDCISGFAKKVPKNG